MREKMRRRTERIRRKRRKGGGKGEGRKTERTEEEEWGKSTGAEKKERKKQKKSNLDTSQPNCWKIKKRNILKAEKGKKNTSTRTSKNYNRVYIENYAYQETVEQDL